MYASKHTWNHTVTSYAHENEWEIFFYDAMAMYDLDIVCLWFVWQCAFECVSCVLYMRWRWTIYSFSIDPSVLSIRLVNELFWCTGGSMKSVIVSCPSLNYFSINCRSDCALSLHCPWLRKIWALMRHVFITCRSSRGCQWSFTFILTS